MEAIMVVRDLEREKINLQGVPCIGQYVRLGDRTFLVESVVHVHNEPVNLMLVEVDS